MKLVDNWKSIIKRAWSLRLMILAAILSGVEVVLPFLSESIPRGTFAVLSGITVAAAFVARLVAQKGISE